MPALKIWNYLYLCKDVALHQHQVQLMLSMIHMPSVNAKLKRPNFSSSFSLVMIYLDVLERVPLQPVIYRDKTAIYSLVIWRNSLWEWRHCPA
jgi:hypothetical protein